VTCDLNRFEVHTNFTNTAPKVYKFDLAELLDNRPTEDCSLPPLDVLRCLFNDPGQLKPGTTTQQVTEDAAARFSLLANSLRDREVDPEMGAHFLMRLLFCLFSESIGLLPAKLFSRLVNGNSSKPVDFERKLKQLFAAMSAPNGSFGADDIPYFNGGLFSDDQTYPLSTSDLEILGKASGLDWAHIEPAIFGTLFERSLDPSKRSQLGAHYTSKDDILLIVEPVIMAPLRRRWEQVKAEAEILAQKAAAASGGAKTGYKKKLTEVLMGFAGEIANVRILDPACGSGNFLYVALKSLLDLEKQVSSFATTKGLTGLLPRTDPSQLYGIETNVYAHELASIVVWIGYLQWQHDNGYPFGASPILRPLTNIKRMDAVLTHDTDGNPAEPEWPEADFIIGNPPFLGGSKMRAELGEKYVDDLFSLYEEVIPPGADLVCYWFERARAQIADGRTKRAGLLATQSIRGGINRRVLERIKECGDIFMAWSDRDWTLDGAVVHISIIGFDSGEDSSHMLEGLSVEHINADLTGGADGTTAQILLENSGLCFRADEKGGPFDVSDEVAQQMLRAPVNVNGRSNADVLKPWVNGLDVTRRPRQMWIIDFQGMTEGEAAEYELPFQHMVREIERERVEAVAKGKKLKVRDRWWLHRRPGSEMRAAVSELVRYIGTIATGKFRLFVWLDHRVLPDHQLYIFAREDDYFFGVLHSRIHEVWARVKGTQTREAESGFRYTPTSTFETFPFPWPPKHEPMNTPLAAAITEAARELVENRDRWLNPPDATAAELQKRTLTNLYNQKPQWLLNLHKALDAAAFAAYGWPDTLTDAEILERLLALNHERAAAQGNKGKLTAMLTPD
jgi:type II restriction/modification system DNA methylase subunit YeeA